MYRCNQDPHTVSHTGDLGLSFQKPVNPVKDTIRRPSLIVKPAGVSALYRCEQYQHLTIKNTRQPCPSGTRSCVNESPVGCEYLRLSWSRGNDERVDMGNNAEDDILDIRLGVKLYCIHVWAEKAKLYLLF